jgi:thymidylate synthase (FAD)
MCGDIEVVRVAGTVSHVTLDNEGLIEYLGRVSTNTYRDADYVSSEEFIGERIAEGHLGLLEHNYVTFLVTGISRTAANQLVRHRIASYVQQSQRYTDQRANNVVMPDSVADNQRAREVFMSVINSSKDAYAALRELGVPKEDARMVLPLGTETKITVTMNLRTYLHLFDLRISPHAQWEIRRMCQLMLLDLCEYAPSVFVDYLNANADRYPEFWKESEDV